MTTIIDDSKKKPKRKSNGEGSYMKIGPGKWRVAITAGRDENGKLKRKVFYGKTKEEAKDKAEKYRLDFRSGLLPVNDKITVEEWVKIWIFEYMANRIKPSSMERYEGIYRIYIKGSTLGGIKLKDLRPSHLQTHYNKLIRQDNKTPGVVRTLNKMLKAALNQAFVERYIMLNPCKHVELPKAQQKQEVEIFTLEEQIRFLEAIEGHRDKALFILAMSTGLRIAEILGLRWSDIDLDEGELTVNQTIRREANIDVTKGEKSKESKTTMTVGTPKSQSSRRSVPLLPTIVKELKIHKAMQKREKFRAGEAYMDNNLVFPNELGGPTDGSNVRQRYNKILENNNIPHKKFHALRHTFATRLFEREAPLKTVSKLLGHSDTSITANTYTHVLPDEKIKAIEKLNDIFEIRG